MCESISHLRQLEDAGVAAAVLPSLFEEQLTLDSYSVDSDLSRGAESFAESLNFFPDLQTYNLGPDGYLELIRRAKKAVAIPIIASLNGVTPGGWLRYASMMEQAGADAIELNIYAISTNPRRSGAELEQEFCDLVRQIKEGVEIPLAVKLSPFFTAPVNIAGRFAAAGAKGIVLFNRFYQPDFDLETLDIVPTLNLSHPNELLLRLHWIAIMFGIVPADLAATGGVHSADDVLKAMLAGARVAMMTSALLRNGAMYAKEVLADLERWMEDHEYESIQQMCGSMSYRSVTDPGAFERSNYMRVLSSYTMRPAASIT
jgi:dihydroorotate dehydrogenase (fumarate)